MGQLTIEIEYKGVYENEMKIKKLQLAHFLRLDNEMIKREMNYQLKRLAKNPEAEDTAKTPRWYT